MGHDEAFIGTEPTEAAAEYLMTIRYMHGEGQPVIAARLSERMGVSAATVSDGDATDDVTASVAVIAPSAITLSVTPSKVKGIKTADLIWSGANSNSVDVYRDDAVIAASTPNDGAYRDSIGKGGGTHTYKVCEAGTTTCSPLVSASY